MARSCRAIFNEVQSKRRFACGGLYKFEEDEYRLSLMELELERIAAWKNNEEPASPLRHCTREDAYLWIRELPHGIAEQLGHVLPALGGLKWDGVPKVEIDRLKNKYSCLMDPFIDDCDAVMISLKSGIKAVYKGLRQRKSAVMDLTSCASRLIDLILSDVRSALAESAKRKLIGVDKGANP